MQRPARQLLYEHAEEHAQDDLARMTRAVLSRTAGACRDRRCADAAAPGGPDAERTAALPPPGLAPATSTPTPPASSATHKCAQEPACGRTSTAPHTSPCATPPPPHHRTANPHNQPPEHAIHRTAAHHITRRLSARTTWTREAGVDDRCATMLLPELLRVAFRMYARRWLDPATDLQQ